jgi:uncharacterized alkaline shock family protein YloU
VRGYARAGAGSGWSSVEYGRVLPEVSAAVQERVADALARMCDVEVEAVHITVEELDRQ